MSQQLVIIPCSDCSETFDLQVWHCPVCAHHWDFSRVECWNCHEYMRPMLGDEARACITRINEYSESLFNEVKELYDREGWRVLGYKAFRECAIAEFTFSKSRIYQLLDAAEVRDIFPPMVEKPESERQLRELAKLRIEGTHEYDTELQKAVWQIAQQTAPVSDQGRKLITASHIKSVAQVLTDVVKSGGLDDGSGEIKPLGVLIDAAVTEETYERLMRQKGHIKQARDFRREEQIAAIEVMPRPEGKYHVIVADPPWAYESRKEDATHRARNQYPSMDLDSICQMSVSDLALDDCVLWLWTTNAFMAGAHRVAESWGFQVKTILTWAKDRMGLGDWLRGQTEHCLMCVKGKPIVRLTNQTTLLYGPMREHSRKPDEFFQMVDQLCVGSKCELFSRAEREGWDCFGAEVEMFT